VEKGRKNGITIENVAWLLSAGCERKGSTETEHDSPRLIDTYSDTTVVDGTDAPAED
jgi:hypothetical protein